MRRSFWSPRWRCRKCSPMILQPLEAVAQVLRRVHAAPTARCGRCRGTVRSHCGTPRDHDLAARVAAAATTARGRGLSTAAAAHAARSLDALRPSGRERLTRALARRRGHRREPAHSRIDLARRHRLMGAGAELFYEQPLHIVRGSGVWLYDARRAAPISMSTTTCRTSGIATRRWCAPFRSRRRSWRPTRAICTRRILEYAERLTATLPAPLDACIFVNSGSEANDVAWRIAQSAPATRGGLVMEHAYHGITDAVAALTPGTGQPRDPRVATLAVPPAALRALDDSMARPISRRSARDADRAIDDPRSARHARRRPFSWIPH